MTEKKELELPPDTPYADPLPEGYAWSEKQPLYHGRLAVDRVRIAPGRRVLLAPEPWPYAQPELCMTEHPFTWMFRAFLICQGCGLDGMSVEWEFDVAVSTHDWLQRGVTVLDYRRVIVLAEYYAEASLTAYALAAGPDNVCVTEILWRY